MSVTGCPNAINFQRFLMEYPPLSYFYNQLHITVFCVCPASVAGLTGRCSLFGRQHIHTFDGVLYEFPGDCSYLLAGDCSHRSFILLGESHSFKLSCPLMASNTHSVQIVGLCRASAMVLIITGTCVLKHTFILPLNLSENDHYSDNIKVC